MEKRIFLSIDLPQNIRDELHVRQQPEVRWIKWMKLGNLHITLNFLGELDDTEIELVKQVIVDTAPYYKPFQIRIAQTDAERDMLWLIPEESETLLELQKELKEKFRKSRIGKRERREYVPHILFAK